MKRSIGIRGYVGELLLKQYLETQYPKKKKYAIVEQIKPTGYNRCGGPYLDFGVIYNGEVIAVYEAKTQDYALDTINGALIYLWRKRNKKNLQFVLQNTSKQNKYNANKKFKAYAVLIKKPSKKGKKIIKNIIYFKKILRKRIYIKKIQTVMKKDLYEEIKFIKGK